MELMEYYVQAFHKIFDHLEELLSLPLRRLEPSQG
jgi:hypothetical protein